jgi:thioredoxin 1
MSKEIMFIALGLLIAFAISSFLNGQRQGDGSNFQTQIEPNAYTQSIAAKHRPRVVDFSATWCGPCKRYAPTFEIVKAKYEQDIDFDSKDIDANEQLAEQLGVGGVVPTTLLFDSTGKKVGQIQGAIPQSVLEEAVLKLISKAAS